MKNIDKNTFLDIDLKAIGKNYKIIKKRVNNNCVVAATVKADAYGLGVEMVVPKIIKSGCRYFFVATTNEAIELRNISKKISIFILNGLVTNEINKIQKYNLIPVINNLEQLAKIEKYQTLKKINLNIALHFDTGMSRLGLDKYETNHLIKNQKKLIKKSYISLVMSHLACADDRHSKFNAIQLKRFLKIIEFFPKAMHSLSNSAGTLLGKKYHFDMVRPGISLYGGHCRKNEGKIYNNVISLRAKLIQIREIYKDDTIGYGATFRAKSKMKIGTLALGYADGFNRKFSNNYHIYFKNNKVKIVGRVSMDLITINLTNIKINKNVGSNQFDIISNKNSVNSIAKLINTIPYEILTSLGKRYQKRYIS